MCVCTYVCIMYVRTYVCMYVCVCVCSRYICVYMYVYMYLRTSICIMLIRTTYVCMLACTHACIKVAIITNTTWHIGYCSARDNITAAIFWVTNFTPPHMSHILSHTHTHSPTHTRMRAYTHTHTHTHYYRVISAAHNGRRWDVVAAWPHTHFFDNRIALYKCHSCSYICTCCISTYPVSASQHDCARS
jgi:hypothetical protein